VVVEGMKGSQQAARKKVWNFPGRWHTFLLLTPHWLEFSHVTQSILQRELGNIVQCCPEGRRDAGGVECLPSKCVSPELHYHQKDKKKEEGTHFGNNLPKWCHHLKFR
jgi:hypothetical protein